jgi:hypothetical protein
MPRWVTRAYGLQELTVVPVQFDVVADNTKTTLVPDLTIAVQEIPDLVKRLAA